MGLGVTVVDLYGIAELNDGLRKLPLLVVALSTLQVFELFGVAILRAAPLQQ